MKVIIILALLIIPYSAVAVTNCHYVEFPDHYDAVCLGDEKSAPDATANRSAAAPNPVPVKSSEVTPKSLPTDTAGKSVPVANVGPVTGKKAPGVASHRQGRQQYQDLIQEAREKRGQALAEDERNRPYQAPSPPVQFDVE